MDDRLEKFVCVVEQAGFGKAAAALHISQPALSTAIQKLERELGVQLLERQGRGIHLTAAGQIAYGNAKQLEVQRQNLHLQLADYMDRRPSVTIGMIDSLAELIFVHDNRFAQLDNDIDISLVVDNSLRLTQAVGRGELALAFLTKPTQEHEAKTALESLDDDLLGNEPLVLVTHQRNKQYYQAQLQRGVLPDFLSYNNGSFSRQHIQQVFDSQGITVASSFHSTNPGIMLEMVLQERGAAVLPYIMVRQPVAAGKLAALPVGGATIFERPIYLARRRNRQLPAPITAACNDVADSLKAITNAAGQVFGPGR